MRGLDSICLGISSFFFPDQKYINFELSKAKTTGLLLCFDEAGVPHHDHYWFLRYKTKQGTSGKILERKQSVWYEHVCLECGIR